MAMPPRVVPLKVIKFSAAGLGLGEWISPTGHSHVVEVPFSAPGDEGFVQLIKKKRRIYQSQPIEWMHLSESRVTPRCGHFGHCGGCRWQHISYEVQIKQKEEWIKQCFHYLNSSVAWHSIIPCEPPWGYRNKMELSFSRDKFGTRYLGLILYGTRGHVFQMKECHLIDQWVAHAVQAVSDWWLTSGLDSYHPFTNKGSLRTLTLRQGERTGDRMAMLTVSGDPEFALNPKQLKEFVSAVRSAIEPKGMNEKLSVFLRIQQIAKGSPTQFYEMLLYGPDHIREILNIQISKETIQTLLFHISPTAFFQPSTKQAEKLYLRAIQLTGIPEGALVYDLYCGTGTLGICMAGQAQEVVGIELSPESALDARENAKRNQLSNVSIYTGDVGSLLPSILKDKGRPQVVFVDPPRSGLDKKALQHLLDIKAPQLTYISCNPSTQARDVEVLM